MDRVRSHHLQPVPDAPEAPEERRRQLLQALEAPPSDGFEIVYLFYQ